MKRLLATLAAAAALVAAGLPAVSAHDRHDDDRGRAKFELLETTIPEIQKALQTDVISIARLTRMYLKRIAAYDDAGPGINAYLHVNDDATRRGAPARRAPSSSRPLPEAALRHPDPPQGQHRHRTTCRPRPAAWRSRIDPARRCVHHEASCARRARSSSARRR